MRRPEEQQRLLTVSSSPWRLDDVSAIAALEQTWPPWLRNTRKNIKTIADSFPAGQVALKDYAGRLVATMTATRINWNGNRKELGTWDNIAGVKNGQQESRNFAESFDPNGNVYCIMSSSVRPDIRGIGLGSKLMESAIDNAIKFGAERVIGSFHPGGYGAYKLREIDANRPFMSFEKYCLSRRNDGELLDPWLKIAERHGFRQLGENPIDEEAMVVKVSVETFDGYRRDFNPGDWRKISGENGKKEIWACGQVGDWTVDRESGEAIYTEPNYLMEKALN